MALAPMNIGSVLGAAFTIYRFNPRAMILLPLLLFGGLGALSVPLTYLLSRSLDGFQFADSDPSEIILSLVPSVLGLMVISLISVAVIPFIAVTMHAAVLGDKISIGSVWARARGRIPAIIGFSLLFGLALLLPACLLAVPFFFIHWDDSSGIALGISLIGLLLAGYGVYTLWFSTKGVLGAPALVLERLGPIEAIRRSFRLTHGAFWPVLGTYLLASIIASFAAQVVSYAITLPLELIVATSSPDNELFGAVLTVPVSFLVQAIVLPFTYAVVTLIYIDRRIKTEAYDVELLRLAVPSTAAQFGAIPPGPQPGRPGVWNAR